MEVVSLEKELAEEVEKCPASDALHGETNEKISQIPLSGRVREIPNVKTSSLGCTRNDSFILGSVDGITPSDVVRTSRSERSDVGISQGLGDVVNGRHVERGFSISRSDEFSKGKGCLVQEWMKAVRGGWNSVDRGG